MFDTHKLNEKGLSDMKIYKSTVAHSTKQVMELMPEGREKSIFKTKMEEAVFFGAKAIASNSENHSEITEY